MAGHNGHKIHEFGKKYCIENLFYLGFELEKESKSGTILSKDGVNYLLSVNVKTHTEHQNEKVTGKNIEALDKLEIKKSVNQCDDILFVFYDIKSKSVYYNSYTELKKSFMLGDVEFPCEAVTHSGRILYWSIFQMRNLIYISENDIDYVSKLKYDNKFSKKQTTLF